VPDHVFDAVRKHFSEEELVSLSLAVVAITGWNQLNVAFRTEAGNYQVPMRQAANDRN